MRTSAIKLVKQIISMFTLVLLVSTSSLLAQDNFSNGEEYVESDMAIEDWMTNMDSFYDVYTEPELEVETWMASMDAFFTSPDSENLPNELLLAESEVNEEPLQVEAWMLNMKAFATPQLDRLASIKSIEIPEPQPVMMAIVGR